jgi:hypothetical protein
LTCDPFVKNKKRGEDALEESKKINKCRKNSDVGATKAGKK